MFVGRRASADQCDSALQAELFVLPASFELVRVSGVVFMPDGRPAARIRVYSWLGEKGYNLLGEPVTTNPDGRFSLLVSAGYLYRVSVEHLAANGTVSARVESQPFKAGSDSAPLVLRLVPVKSPDR